MKYGLLLLLLLLFVAGCTQPIEKQETILIGGIFALSGGGAQFGTDELQGAQLAVDEINSNGGINDSLLDLQVEDFQTDASKIVSAYTKLTEVQNIKYVVGATWGPFSAILIPLLDDVILISPSTGEEEDLYKNPLFFKTWPADIQEIESIAQHMVETNVSKVAVVTSQGSWAQNMKDGFYTYAQDANISIVLDEVMAVDEFDFRTTLLKIKDSRVDAIYLVLNEFDAAGAFGKQMIEIDFKLPVYAWSGFENYGMLEKYGLYIEHFMYPLPVVIDRDIAFNEKFKAKYSHDPLTPVAATSYDAVQMLAIALEQGGNISDNLLTIRNYSGASAIQQFNEFGWAQHDRDFRLRTVRDGAFVNLK